MHRAPNSVAFLTPFQRATGCGSFHRNSPTGGAANGMPLKITTFPSALCSPRHQAPLPCAPAPAPQGTQRQTTASPARCASLVSPAHSSLFSPSAPGVSSCPLAASRTDKLPTNARPVKSKSRTEPYSMVGRLTRRIYIYGLDGLVGIPENLVGLPLTICAK